MRMIRKQLYITPEQQRKLHRVAKRRGCSEAEIVRETLDALPDPEGTFEERLRAAGLLLPPRDDPDLPTTPEEVEKEEQEFETWLATQTEPLGLSQAVWEDREGR